MPPPRLSATTTVRSGSVPARPGRRRRGGRPGRRPGPRWARPARATPRAVDTTPSMPLAPRLANARGGRALGPANASMSRTGMDDETTRVASSGRRGEQAVGQERFGEYPAVVALAQGAGHRPGPGPRPAASPPTTGPVGPTLLRTAPERPTGDRPGEEGGVGPDELGRPVGVGPPSPGVDHDDGLPRRRPGQEPVDHLGRPALAEADDALGPVAVGERSDRRMPSAAPITPGVRAAARTGGRRAPASPGRRPGPAPTRAPRTRPRPR